MKRVLVCGGRKYGNAALVDETLDEFKPEETILLEGGGDGADRFARMYAYRWNWVGIFRFDAAWNRHGDAAGPIRNRNMLVHGQPDLVIAFPGGKGTANMVEIAEKAGVPVRKVDW